MFNPVIVVLKRTASVVWRINKDALDLAGELLFEGFEGEEVVTEDEAIVENVVVGDAVWGVVRLLGIFQQNTRL